MNTPGAKGVGTGDSRVVATDAQVQPLPVKFRRNPLPFCAAELLALVLGTGKVHVLEAPASLGLLGQGVAAFKLTDVVAGPTDRRSPNKMIRVIVGIDGVRIRSDD